MDLFPITWARVTASEKVFGGPCDFYGAVILASAAGGDASIYDGEYPEAADKVLTLKGDADISNPVIPPQPLYLTDGLYVEIGANCDEVTVFYMPVTKRAHGLSWIEQMVEEATLRVAQRLGS